MAFWLRLASAWFGFLLLWLVFVFQVSPSELVVGAIASGLTVFAGYITFRVVPPCFAPRLRWIAPAWHLPPMVATDLWLLLKHLGREIARKPSQSSFQMTPFRATGADPHSAAQRALAVLFVSTTPNSVVLDIDFEARKMLFHQLEPAPVPAFLPELQK